jgi:hypothetical protein
MEIWAKTCLVRLGLEARGAIPPFSALTVKTGIVQYIFRVIWTAEKR